MKLNIPNQLTHSLNHLQGQIQQATLPSWPALQTQFNVILTQLMSLSGTLASFSEILQRTVTYPLPNFPALTETGLLTTLLRKKNQPEVQEWIEQGREAAKDVKITTDDDFSSWAADMVENAKDQHEWTGFLTREQVEAGETDSGMRRGQEENGGWSIDEVIGFMSRGEVRK
jgi:mediator of RNA polymerase II transcription subunit 8, fungi type